MDTEGPSYRSGYDDEAQHEYLDQQEGLSSTMLNKDVDEGMLAEETTNIIAPIHSGGHRAAMEGGVDDGQEGEDGLGKDDPLGRNLLYRANAAEGVSAGAPTNPTPRGLMASPFRPPDRGSGEEFTARQQEIKDAIDASRVLLSAEWLYNAWTRDDNPPAWRDALAALSTEKLLPGYSRYVFTMGQAMSPANKAEGRLKSVVEICLDIDKIRASAVRLFKVRTAILGVDIKFAPEADVDPSLFKIKYEGFHLEHDKTSRSLGEGLLALYLDPVLARSIDYIDDFIRTVITQLNARGYELRCLWSIFTNLRGAINGPPRYREELLAVVELIGEDRKVHGWLYVPGSPRCYVWYPGRGRWCYKCTWRAEEQHKETAECKAAEAKRRSKARAAKAVPRKESSIDPVPPMRGHKLAGCGPLQPQRQ
ncbi:hypothetical protein IE81DRAFT_361404 [Ceraceosorus guamensis]|uniref:Uncharacterized protein n=1 Tax=Ceraceosorus guamensis TaxID=1522189 RepID=A0A316W5I3_9BASI|nr:hypothetical protein IE81DRAFT_361404 [Ceraceosorus guamensis]PWN45002.1 hypothetical protein IE81DRAFT_361404 [Ceraceosorus guamensis]